MENYLIGWVLNFGLLGCIGLLLATYTVPVRLICRQEFPAQVALLSFMLISLTNNALTVKTPALVLFVVALVCRYRSPDRSLASNSH